MPSSSFCNTTFELAESTFNAYLKAGTTWPQVRGSINIGVLANLSIGNCLQDFTRFVNSQFSTKQRESTTNAMLTLHNRAGVLIPLTHIGSLLHTEWERSKGSVVVSLTHRLTGTRSLEIRRKTLEDYAKTDYPQFIEMCLKSDTYAKEFKIISDMAITASATLDNNREMAKLFVLSLYRDEQRLRAYNQHRKLYEKLINKYKMTHNVLSNPFDFKKEVLGKIDLTIRNNLQRQFPAEDIDWIAWGFIN
ncbi:hypothetical protein SAMD00079811_82620 (plasmid) [Scytonema sp. HK-05]|uniref:hypothetical protein n=1 Tax=Scytonema sp. HK-05 TaxID=1137095 RepID=UPI000936BABE|nr:hypothetical protein [Scytonema sp. HK-05]OKH48882.1 hypothetical protein NIES2130_35105 [Scytonema sp. HK-05]BAY50633.1 hypothetical protein SAMD00079811_82620 [Scytonema sp. HK-05]